MTHVMAKGANIALPVAAVRAVLRWSATPGAPDVDASALLLGTDGKVRSDADFVFYNQPRHPSGLVRHLPKQQTSGGTEIADTVEADLGKLPAEVERVVLAGSSEGGSFRSVSGLRLLLFDAGAGEGATAIAEFAMADGDEVTALVAGELYRRGGVWKFRAVGQGYSTGLIGLATDFGITVEEGPAQDRPVAPPPQLPQPQPSRPAPSAPSAPEPGKGEEHLPPGMRERLSLRKQQVAVSLDKHGAAGIAARVVLVLDASGSMSSLYADGVVADVVERIVPVAAQLDDGGAMPAWTFATHPARLPDLRVGDLPEWLRLHVRVGELGRLFGRRGRRSGLLDGQVDMTTVGISNDEPKVITEVRDYVRGNAAAVPTLVLFFSDGGVHLNAAIERELRESAQEPLFWQFVGLGRSDYGVLQRFDDLPGRRVDNVGFFAVDDIGSVPDPELYDRLLSQFPQWITAARGAGILP
ncbi:VWA domain-containing protein [Kitasatospora sp. NPDC001574]